MLSNYGDFKIYIKFNENNNLMNLFLLAPYIGDNSKNIFRESDIDKEQWDKLEKSALCSHVIRMTNSIINEIRYNQ